MKEDACQIYQNHAAENWSILGRVDVFCLDFVRTGGALIAKRGVRFSYSK
ncbi:hypothetical protein AEST_12840 [Alishewanella aestuarii B11]|uniref:Uncharacterized protein n=1 Tax=Alishewanella aestuarii B11 TaxID=1197174 RepID=J2IFD3_9ALTE|nr:hypothetical protein [Alishewanella aestuarii]EJI85882.1 hypothetical protein AEST_12840 [Alishewanella aestuarii B11]